MIHMCSGWYMYTVFSPNSVGTLRGSYGRRKERVLGSLFRAGMSG